VTRLAGAVLDEVGHAIVGKREALSLVLCGVLAGGHVLLEDLPGLGKTLAARSFATALGLRFGRAQFTPDLPADSPGRSFSTSERTSSSSAEGRCSPGSCSRESTHPAEDAGRLEAMQGGRSPARDVPPEACSTSATANPISTRHLQSRLSSTGSCPHRLRISTVYEARGGRRMGGGGSVRSGASSTQTLLAMQAAIEHVVVDADVSRYCVDIVTATRHHAHVSVGASPRGSLALVLCGRARAVIAGRDYVTPEDVKAVAPAVLAHRITIRPELWLSKATGSSVVGDVLGAVPTPPPGGGRQV
jgi:MoxR-like ATPase